MKKPSIIRKVLALAMLVLFTLSISPKTYWHKCLAHQDKSSLADFSGKAMLSKSGSDCHCNELVVSMPFMETMVELCLYSFASYKELSFTQYHYIYFNKHATRDLRGPPSIA